jgi:hypothetical protein
MTPEQEKAWEKICRGARIKCGASIQEGFLPDPIDYSILAIDKERESLRAEVERLRGDVEKKGLCVSCGVPLSSDCPRCKKLWES